MPRDPSSAAGLYDVEVWELWLAARGLWSRIAGTAGPRRQRTGFLGSQLLKTVIDCLLGLFGHVVLLNNMVMCSPFAKSPTPLVLLKETLHLVFKFKCSSKLSRIPLAFKLGGVIKHLFAKKKERIGLMY